MIERELVSLGFASDRKPGKPLDFSGMKVRRKSKGKRARIAPSNTYAAQYKRAMRARQIARGIIKPRTPEEFALAQTVVEVAAIEPESVRPALHRVGDGPLAIWLPRAA